MKYSEAEKIVKKIHGQTIPVDYRNVWGFFPGTDTDFSAVFITKDTSTAPLSGVFLDDGKHDGFIDYETGEEVDPSLVFGRAFYEDDPNIFNDDTDRNTPICERMNAVASQIEDLLSERQISSAAMLMVYDVMEDEKTAEETALRRLLALRNYLSKSTTKMSITDFSYIHHELYGIE